MSIKLAKGDKVALAKDRVINNIAVGLGWSISSYNDDDYDLDVSCFILQANGKTRYDEDFVFYNNPQSKNGSVMHSGDDTHGSDGQSDNEVIFVNLKTIPSYATRLVFVVSIFEAERRSQNFGLINKSYIRVNDVAEDEEILRYDLKEKFTDETCIIAGEIYKDGETWKFHAVGESAESLAKLCEKFGLEVE